MSDDDDDDDDQWFVYEWCLVFASSWIFNEKPEYRHVTDRRMN